MSEREESIQDIHRRYLETGEETLQAQIVEHYFPFVKKIAVKLAERLNWNVQPDELASLGVDGLYRAIEHYDPDQGAKFETYANQRIRGSMIDGLRRQDTVPRSVRMAADRFAREKQRIQNERGRRVSDVECADLAGVNDFTSNHTKYIPAAVASIDQTIDTESYEEMGQDTNYSLIDNEAPSPDESLKRHELLSKLMGNGFTRVEQRIIYYYYYRQYTMSVIADKVGLSESRVSQMHKKILDSLRSKVQRNPYYFDETVYDFLGV